MTGFYGLGHLGDLDDLSTIIETLQDIRVRDIVIHRSVLYIFHAHGLPAQASRRTHKVATLAAVSNTPAVIVALS